MKQPTKIYVKSDDLSYDGKTLLIPAYWTETMLDMINSQVQPEDLQDAQLLKDFLSDVINYQADNRGN